MLHFLAVSTVPFCEDFLLRRLTTALVNVGRLSRLVCLSPRPRPVRVPDIPSSISGNPAAISGPHLTGSDDGTGSRLALGVPDLLLSGEYAYHIRTTPYTIFRVL